MKYSIEMFYTFLTFDLIQQMSDYSIVMDLDTLVITCKLTGSNKFEVYVFRMTRDSDIDLQQK